MSRKKTIVLVIALMVFIAGAVSAWLILRPKTNKDAKSIEVTIQHLDGATKELTVSGNGEYLYDMMKPMNIIQGEQSTYGFWVQTVDGETADASKEQWWGFYINGEMGNYSVDTQPVSDGDKVLFVLTEGYGSYGN